MLRAITVALVLLAAPAGRGAERIFDFSESSLNQTPKGFSSTVSGKGNAGSWQVILDEVKPTLAPLSPNPSITAKQHVLAQLAQDVTDEHFPILFFDEDTYTDFTVTTKFKTVSGTAERMAGLVFRAQDERNYYVVRASSLGSTFRFYKVVNGERGELIGPSLPIPSGQWHELTVECKANQIRCLLDGQEAIPPLTDNTFSAGKIGFWTKSDSITYFTDAKILYTPRENLAQTLVRDMIDRYPRLHGIKIFAPVKSTNDFTVIASTNAKDMREPAPEYVPLVISKNGVNITKEKSNVAVTMTLHDRNGDGVAAVQVSMEPFPGQTEQTFIVRTLPIVKQMEQRIKSVKDLFE